jgi:hypothetical protein
MRASRVMISRGASRVRRSEKKRPQHLGGKLGPFRIRRPTAAGTPNYSKSSTRRKVPMS